MYYPDNKITCDIRRNEIYYYRVGISNSDVAIAEIKFHTMFVRVIMYYADLEKSFPNDRQGLIEACKWAFKIDQKIHPV